MGFGASSKLRTDRIEVLSLDLPVVIECVDSEERIAAILPELDDMLGGGLITLERARVIMYRPELRKHERTSSHDIDITGRWQSDTSD
jgi:PII-like signaling protein